MALSTMLQIMAFGGPDSVIYDEPQSTSWRYVHMRHTKHAIDNASVQLSGTQRTGNSTVTNFPREGDLITYLYVVIDIPGLSQGKYIERVGQALVENVQILLGSQCIDDIGSDYLFMWDCLTGKAGKRLGEMIGSDPEMIHPSNHIEPTTGDAKDARSERAQRLHVPIPFWFNSAMPGGVTGNALPLISLQFHAVTVKLKLRSILDCVTGLTSGQTARIATNQTISAIGEQFKAPGTGIKVLSDADTQAHLEVGYVYLDNEERSRFADSNMEVLVMQRQNMTRKRSKNTTECHRLYFNHPVSELLWAVRRPDAQLFDYSGKQQIGSTPIDHFKLDPITSVQLKFNNHSRFNMSDGKGNKVPASYFRTVQPFQHHSRIPDARNCEFVYCYSFALNPESAQPSGTVNFSRIDNTILELCYDMDDQEHETLVFANNWNILRVSSGMAGLAYSN